MDINRATDATDEEISELFDHQPWTASQTEAGKAVRMALGKAFQTIIRVVPPCPDRSTALRKIREARMDANSAVTHSGKY